MPIGVNRQLESCLAFSEPLSEKLLQKERLVAVGRITSAFVHETNNALQIILGALNLAAEDPDDRQALNDYLAISLSETRRTIRLMELIRQIYHPKAEGPQKVDLVAALHNALATVRDYLKQSELDVQVQEGSGAIKTTADPGQLQLALVSLLLNIAEAIREAGGRQLGIRAITASAARRLEFTSDIKLNSGLEGIDLTLVKEIVRAQSGEVILENEAETTTLYLDFPAVE